MAAHRIVSLERRGGKWHYGWPLQIIANSKFLIK